MEAEGAKGCNAITKLLHIYFINKDDKKRWKTEENMGS
jgi:hypothetical protein